MQPKLNEVFNKNDKVCQSLAERLEQVLAALSAKLSSLPEGQDILMVQVPIDQKYAEGLTPQARSEAVQAAMQSYRRVVQAFEMKAIEKFPDIDIKANSSNSVWGDHIFLTIVTSQPSVTAKVLAAGARPENPAEVSQAMQKVLGEKGSSSYVLMQGALQMVHGMMQETRAAGKDPNNMGQIDFDAGPNPARYHGRYAFWDVDPSWPKPALLPEFAHLFPAADIRKDDKPPKP